MRLLRDFYPRFIEDSLLVRTIVWNEFLAMKSDPPMVEVMEKAVRVLELLAVYPQGATLQLITSETGIPKSSVHRLLTTWERLRYVTRLGGGCYQLGLAALEL